jgi:hypothetical protein
MSTVPDRNPRKRQQPPIRKFPYKLLVGICLAIFLLLVIWRVARSPHPSPSPTQLTSPAPIPVQDQKASQPGQPGVETAWPAGLSFKEFSFDYAARRFKGVLENSSARTYRDTALLIDCWDSSSTQSRIRIPLGAVRAHGTTNIWSDPLPKEIANYRVHEIIGTPE